MWEQCCDHSKQCRNNIATLCYATNHWFELSRVTSPLERVGCVYFMVPRSTLRSLLYNHHHHHYRHYHHHLFTFYLLKLLMFGILLQKLHPHLEKWGALIRIYCDRPTGAIKKVHTDFFGGEKAFSPSPPLLLIPCSKGALGTKRRETQGLSLGIFFSVA